MTTQMTSAEALETVYDVDGKIKKLSAPFVCPYPDCRVYAEHYWGVLKNISVMIGYETKPSRTLRGSEIHAARCTSCNQEVLFLDGKLIKPSAGDAPAPAQDMPNEIRPEYEEAAAILRASPRGSAALLRLAVQKLLPLLGASKRDINAAIGELVAAGVISTRTQAALDALRVIGNEAVHPGTIELRDDVGTAMGLFRLLNYIVEKAISDPKHAEEMFALLPQGKKDAILARDKPQESKS